MLEYLYLLAKIGADTAENGPTFEPEARAGFEPEVSFGALLPTACISGLGAETSRLEPLSARAGSSRLFCKEIQSFSWNSEKCGRSALTLINIIEILRNSRKKSAKI